MNMYYHFQIFTWVYDPDPAAAAQGCGHSVSDFVDTESIDLAVHFFMKKYPTARKKGIRIICKALDIDRRLEEIA